jgi:high-affinity K+ transport system ATPase subunit B
MMAAACTADMTVIVAGDETTETPPEVAVKVTLYVPSLLTLNVVIALVGLPKVAVEPTGWLETFH